MKHQTIFQTVYNTGELDRITHRFYLHPALNVRANQSQIFT